MWRRGQHKIMIDEKDLRGLLVSFSESVFQELEAELSGWDEIDKETKTKFLTKVSFIMLRHGKLSIHTLKQELNMRGVQL